MYARRGCWSVPQLLLELEARVNALEKSKVTLYEHNIEMLVASSGTPVANPRLTIYNDNALPFTNETILAYIEIAKAKSATGVFSNKGMSFVAHVSNVGFRAGFDNGDIVAFDTVLSITDNVLPVTLNLQV